jgi:hypothetical protein
VATYRLQITCVSTTSQGFITEVITHVGTSGQMWTKDEAISAAENGLVQFFTRVAGHEAPVHVVRPRYGSPYLHTHPDGYGPNNLLALDRCWPR